MSDAEAPIIEARDVVKSFAGRRTVGQRMRRESAASMLAVDHVSISLRRHEVLAIVGESGSGKTTLARCLVRLYEPDSGSITAFGTDIASCRGEDLLRFRRRVQIVYQDPYSSLNPRMTVGHAIGEAARVHGLVDRGGEEGRVKELLEMVGLSATLAKRRPRELSGGQRQRVAIARALAVEPEVMVADEVLSALDVSVQAQVLNLFQELIRELGFAMIFISHQLSLVARLADRVAVMYLGKVVEEGSAQDIFLRASHPYTQALLRALPSVEPGVEREPALPAGAASVAEVAGGCRFRARCPLAYGACELEDPGMQSIGEGHAVACHAVSRASPESDSVPSPAPEMPSPGRP